MTRRNPEKKVEVDFSGDVVIPKVVEQKKKTKSKNVEEKNIEEKKDMQCKIAPALTIDDLRQKLIDTACFTLEKIKRQQLPNSSELLDVSLRIYHEVNAVDIKDDIKSVISTCLSQNEE